MADKQLTGVYLLYSCRGRTCPARNINRKQVLAGKLRAGHARPLQSGILNGYLLFARAVVALTTPVAVTLKPDGVLRQLGVKALGDLHHQGALHPLAEHLAAVLIGAVDVAGSVQGVGRAAATAIQLGEAVGTFLMGVDVAALELIADG